MVSIHTSSQISMDSLHVEAPGSLPVEEASNLTEENLQNITNRNENDTPSISANSTKSSSEADGKYLEHFRGETVSVKAEKDSIKAEENGLEEVYHRDTKMQTPLSSVESFSENDSEFGSSRGESCQSQHNSGSLEKNYSSKQHLLRKRFREVVKLARKTLAEARAAAQQESVTKRYEVAARKKRELQRRRAQKKRETPSQHARSKALISLNTETPGTIAWDKTEMKETRQIHAELDRARAKKSQVSSRRDRLVSVTNTTTLQPLLNKNSGRDNYEIERLIKELHSLNLSDKASELAHAFSRKMETERELRSQLKRERREALLEAKRLKLEEMARLKEEERRRQLEEKARLERERREREEIERMKKLEEDRQKKVHNLHMWASFHRVGLANSVSRTFTSSYFPKLHNKVPSKEVKKAPGNTRICTLGHRSHEAHTKGRKTPKR